MPISPISAPGRPLYEELRANLTEAIARGDWMPGQAIPAEAELARRFGVAIGTVRKGVDALVAGQVLVRRQGKGTFVTEHDGNRLLFHFFHIVGRDGMKTYPDVRTVAFRRDRADAAIAKALGIAPLEKVVRIRNLLMLRGAPVIVDDITLPGPLYPGLTERSFVARENTIYHFYQRRYGINVLRADERIAATVANGEIATLLQVAPGTPLLEIRRIALSFRDRPVEYRVSLVNTAHHVYHNAFAKGAVL